MDNKVSVIIPVYNTVAYLAACLESVCSIMTMDIEIICVDDGSTDKSLEILTTFAQKDSRIHIISQKHQGVSIARNVGITTATGKYIQFLDSDDMLAPGALEYAVRQMNEKQLDVFYFDAQAIFESIQLEEEKRRYKTYYHRENHYQNVQAGYQLFTKWIKDGGFRPNGNLQMIRRDFLLQSDVRYIPGIVQEDNAFTAEIKLHAQRVCHVNKPLYIRRVRSGSIMTKPPAFSNAYGYFRCAMTMEKYFFKPTFSENSRCALQIFCQNLVQNMEKIYKNIPEEEKAKIRMIPVEERGVMLYLCWYSEQASINQKEKNKINAECRAMRKEKAVLVKQNEKIQYQNSAYQQQIKKQEGVIQKLNDTLQNEKKIFTRNYQEISVDKQKWQNQCSSLEKQVEEIRHENMVYQQQMTEQSKEFHTLQADFFAMQQSLSFRVGRKLIWLPRKIRDAFFR